MAALQGCLTTNLWALIMSFAARRRDLATVAVLGGPVLLCALAIVVPLVLTLIISFWERQMIGMRPGFSLASYALFFEGRALLRSEAKLLGGGELDRDHAGDCLPRRLSRHVQASTAPDPDLSLPSLRPVSRQLCHPDLLVGLPSRTHRTRQSVPAMGGRDESARRLAAVQ